MANAAKTLSTVERAAGEMQCCYHRTRTKHVGELQDVAVARSSNQSLDLVHLLCSEVLDQCATGRLAACLSFVPCYLAGLSPPQADLG